MDHVGFLVEFIPDVVSIENYMVQEVLMKIACQFVSIFVLFINILPHK